MKKSVIISFGIVLLILLGSVSTVAARPVDGWTEKPPQDKTPAARATQAALDKETRESGRGKGTLNISGVVEAVEEGLITMKLNDGSLKTCFVDQDTRIKIPGGQAATLLDITAGSKVHLQAKDDDQGCLALKINVIPGKPERKHHVGVVSVYEAGVSITITIKDGSQAAFLITDDTRILPEERLEELGVGSQVTIISPRDVSGGEWQAAGIVVHPRDSGAGEESLEP